MRNVSIIVESTVEIHVEASFLGQKKKLALSLRRSDVENTWRSTFLSQGKLLTGRSTATVLVESVRMCEKLVCVNFNVHLSI